MTEVKKSQAGLTLVEVIVSVALLGMLTVTIMTVFGTSIVNIFASGEKNEAMASAAEVMEQLHSLSSPSEEKIIDQLIAAQGYQVSQKSELFLQQSDTSLQFWLEPVSLFADSDKGEGYEITLVVFYERGAKQVSLRSFIGAGGSSE